MMEQLIESRAKRQSRKGGVVLSVAVHVVVIGIAMVATVQGASAPRSAVEYVPVRLVRPVPDKPRVAPATAAPRGNPVGVSIVVPSIPTPTFVPPSLPEIAVQAGPPLDSLFIGSSRGASDGRGVGHGLDLVGSDGPQSTEQRGVDLLMRIVATGKPRYPESLRQAGIDGRVLVRFTIDTLGRIDMSTVQVVQSTHDLFSRSVRDALPLFRFRPAEVGGARVRSLAEMPFEFSLDR